MENISRDGLLHGIAIHEEALLKLNSDLEQVNKDLAERKNKRYQIAYANQYGKLDNDPGVLPHGNIVCFDQIDPEIQKLESRYAFLTGEIGRIEGKLKILRDLAKQE